MTAKQRRNGWEAKKRKFGKIKEKIENLFEVSYLPVNVGSMDGNW